MLDARTTEQLRSVVIEMAAAAAENLARSLLLPGSTDLEGELDALIADGGRVSLEFTIGRHGVASIVLCAAPAEGEIRQVLALSPSTSKAAFSFAGAQKGAG